MCYNLILFHSSPFLIMSHNCEPHVENLIKMLSGKNIGKVGFVSISNDFDSIHQFIKFFVNINFFLIGSRRNALLSYKSQPFRFELK